jgi:hypothetical protein
LVATVARVLKRQSFIEIFRIHLLEFGHDRCFQLCLQGGR